MLTHAGLKEGPAWECASKIATSFEVKHDVATTALLILSVLEGKTIVQWKELRKEIFGTVHTKRAIALLKKLDLIFFPKHGHYKLTPGGMSLVNENNLRRADGLPARLPRR